MPSPVEALPWGSRSRISTCSPMAASAVPRLMAVVVLRPNFEPLRESVGILGICPAALHIPDDDDTAARIGPAGHQSRIHFPRRHGRAGLSEFKLCILS